MVAELAGRDLGWRLVEVVQAVEGWATRRRRKV